MLKSLTCIHTAWLGGTALGLVPPRYLVGLVPCWPRTSVASYLVGVVPRWRRTSLASYLVGLVRSLHDDDDDSLRRPCQHRFQRSLVLPRSTIILACSLYPLPRSFSACLLVLFLFDYAEYITNTAGTAWPVFPAT